MLHISYTMYTHDLPDMYTLSPQATTHGIMPGFWICFNCRLLNSFLNKKESILIGAIALCLLFALVSYVKFGI